ncbi:60S ribosomal protein L11 [Orobanche gracilis]
MASSSLCAYKAPISISSRDYFDLNNNSGENAGGLPSSCLFNSCSSRNLSSNQTTTLQLLNRRKQTLPLSSTPRPLTVIAMDPPKPGKKPRKVVGVVKLALEAGKATPAPPVGPALGAKGVNIAAFCKDYNARTADKAGYVVPVEVTVYDDRSFTFILKTPPASVLLLKAAVEENGPQRRIKTWESHTRLLIITDNRVEKGSKDPKHLKVGKVTIEQLWTIAQEKLPDLNCSTVESAMRIIAGTAANMGIDVDPPLLVEPKKEELE